MLPLRSRANARQVLVLGHHNSICRSQIYPFYFYARDLFRRYGVTIREMELARFLSSKPGRSDRADIVLLQPWFRFSEQEMESIVVQVKERSRAARIVFLDSYAPADLRFAKVLDPHIDLYVKKNVLRDRALYGRPTRGDTNLTDGFAARYGIDLPEVRFEVPQRLLDRLVVGPGFATADYMLRRFMSSDPRFEDPEFDLHARLGSTGTPWYSAMRLESIARVDSLRGITVLSGTGVSRALYLRELSRSRLCFSPFGYGEVAWRDYEAVMCGSLLLKPDMSHIETEPDVFVPGVTYVPLRWDLADLEDKVRHYLANEPARRQIVEQAFATLRDYFREGRFIDQMGRLFR